MRTRRIPKMPKWWFALILVLVLVLLPCLAVAQAAADTNQAQKPPSAYPSTPKGVVEAFVKAALGEVPITAEQMRLCDEIIYLQDKYFPDDQDVESNRKTRVMDVSKQWGPNLIKLHIAIGFQIQEVTESKDTATVKVLYKRLGWITKDPMYVSECRSATAGKDKAETGAPTGLLEAMSKIEAKRRGWVWDKEGCRFLHMTNDTQQVTYHLARPYNLWRIINLYQPYISISSAVKNLECLIRERPEVRTRYPSEEQKDGIREDIRTLKKLLTNTR